jgi:hypothetical protein
MSSDTLGLERRQCDTEDCEKIHDFCPLCGEKVATYAEFEESPGSTHEPANVEATRVCTEWDGDRLWLYWHEG